MKRGTIIAIVSGAMGLFLLSTAYFADAQGVSYGGTFNGSNVISSDVGIMKPKPKVEINRESIPVLQLVTELVEILPGEIRRLSYDSGDHNGESPMDQAVPGLRAGSVTMGAVAVKGGIMVSYRLKLVRLDRDGLTLDITITDNTNKVLATRALSLRNYEEGMIEFASTEGGDKRLAVRFLPIIKAIPPVQDIPTALLRSMTIGGMLIRNGNELLSRGSVFSFSADDMTGKMLPFISFNSQSTGFLVMSCRPFPGAVVTGYFEDKKLVFEWNGDSYEYLSMDKPFMPEGRWAAYFWQAPNAPQAPPQGMGVGAFVATPDEVAARIGKMMEMRKGTQGFELKPGSDGVTIQGN
jgi:hypothetical protein